VATVHGYGAAWLAVRMLFRPRQAVKVLGITIFPQGMIPRHRGRLAEAIGRAVGNELMSHDTIVNALFEKDFLRKKVEGLVNSYVDEMLSTSYPSLLDALPSSARGPVLDAVSVLQARLGDYIVKTLQSEETVETITGFVERRVDEVLSQKVSEVLDEETFGQILMFLEKRLKGILQEKALESRVRDFVSERIDDLANTQTPLGQMFTEESVALIKDRLGDQIQPIVHQLADIATQERTRKQISSLIKHEINDYYQQLPFYQKIFVSRDKLYHEVDDLVNKTMPQKVEEVLRGEAFAQEAQNFIFSQIDNVLEKPLPELVGKIAPEKLESLKKQVSDSVLAMVQSPDISSSISIYLFDTMHNLRPHSLRALLKKTHTDIEPRLKNMLAKGLLNILSREETQNTVKSVIASQVERLLVTPIGKLTDRVSEETIRKAGNALSERVLATAKERLPAALAEFDIQTIVRDKVNNYPVEKLEALVLSVAQQHLRTIELFGLFIGLLIGIFQAFYFWVFAGK
jgi:uncharacterized membrane protein YheB (UPF0754 family)